MLFGDPATQLGMPANFPYVLSTRPTNGSEGVLLDETIEVVFSKPMDPNTVTLSEPPGSTFRASWSAGFTVLNSSHSDFRPNTGYQITIHGRDRRGNAVGPGIVPNPWAFNTTTDNIPPQRHDCSYER